jgi:hypothetical protein
MKRLSAFFGTALLVLLAAAASSAQADYLNWTYTSNPNVPGIAVNSTSPTGGATVTLTDFNNAQAGAAKIPVIAYVTSTAATTPITFGPSVNSPATYKLALTITDGTTHDSGTLNFTGSIAGSLTATTSSLVNTLTPVTSKSLTLDGHTYTVSIPSVALSAPTSPQQDIFATVTVSNATTGGGNPGGNPGGGHPGPGVQGAPEPGCLLLACLGCSCLGAGCWWKRRHSVARS